MDIVQQRKRDRALQNLDLTGRLGIEVGPLCRPLIGKNECDVYYVDHCSDEELREKYRGDPNVNADEIVPVDFIWKDKPLIDLIEEKIPVDFVLASHVVEHVPDLIGWLKEMHDVLRNGGVLILLVPDKRFTFDVRRPIAAFEEIQRAHFERRRRPGLRGIMDHFANVVSADTWALWDDYSGTDDLQFYHGPEFLSLAAQHYAEGRYIDVHCWVFTPWHFLETLGRIVKETGLGFDLQYFQTTPSHDLEFYVRLERVAEPTTDWARVAADSRQNAIWPKALSATAGEALYNWGRPLDLSGSDCPQPVETDCSVRPDEVLEELASMRSVIAAMRSTRAWRARSLLRKLFGLPPTQADA